MCTDFKECTSECCFCQMGTELIHDSFLQIKRRHAQWPYISDIVSIDQVGYTAGRRVSIDLQLTDNAIDNVTDQLNIAEEPGLLVKIDYSQAYDSPPLLLPDAHRVHTSFFFTTIARCEHSSYIILLHYYCKICTQFIYHSSPQPLPGVHRVPLHLVISPAVARC